MNYRGLKQASRQCLRDSGIGPRRLTAVFLLCLYIVTVSSDMVSLYFDRQLNQTTGFDAMDLKATADLWNVGSLLVVNVLYWLWSAGYDAFTLHLSRGQHASFQDFFQGFRLVGKVISVVLLRAVFVFCWSMLLLIPGIVALYRYRMAVYVILDDPDLTASQALAVSSRLTYGHKGELLMLDLSFFWYYLPTVATMVLANAYNYGFLPEQMYTGQGFWVVYLVTLLLPALMELAAMAYFQTTIAHAYNWLQSLDRARWEEARSW